MELCPPFDGWHLDVHGVIHSPSGYRCTPDQIESALWLAGMLWRRGELGARLIFADTPTVEPRNVSSLSDWISEDADRLQIIARRGVCHCCSKRANP